MTVASTSKTALFRFAVTGANLVIPGSGLVLLGRHALAALFQAVLWASVAIAGWSGWIFRPWGCGALLGLILLVHLAAAVCGLLCKKRGRMLVNGVATALFCVVFVGFGAAGTKTQDAWLGIKIYFIPSPSMAPTLLPGDFVLTDSWHYKRHNAETSDVVVFEQPQENRIYVKRVQEVMAANGLDGYRYHVIGDNHKASLDSRHFGEVNHTSLRGKARLVLFSIDSTSELRTDRVLLKL